MGNEWLHRTRVSQTIGQLNLLGTEPPETLEASLLDRGSHTRTSASGFDRLGAYPMKVWPRGRTRGSVWVRCSLGV